MCHVCVTNCVPEAKFHFLLIFAFLLWQGHRSRLVLGLLKGYQQRWLGSVSEKVEGNLKLTFLSYTLWFICISIGEFCKLTFPINSFLIYVFNCKPINDQLAITISNRIVQAWLLLSWSFDCSSSCLEPPQKCYKFMTFSFCIRRPFKASRTQWLNPSQTASKKVNKTPGVRGWRGQQKGKRK